MVWQPAALASDTVALRVSGGQIVAADNCAEDCPESAEQSSYSTLFAIPAPHYRFAGWEGSCNGAMGPLCTQTTVDHQQLSARFVKTPVPPQAVKALLLLHDPEFKPTVWNQFVKQRFANRCPVVYAGVILENDAIDPDNQVHCYRLAFGYYQLLSRNADADMPPTSANAPTSALLAHEVRAAVLGILNRHPNLSLTLVSQDGAESAAQAFLATDTAKRSATLGLLSLQSPAASDTTPLTTDHGLALRIAATPEHSGKISAALGELGGSWWLTQ